MSMGDGWLIGLMGMALYPYVFYPPVAWLRARWFGRRVEEGDISPDVTFIVPVCNEAEFVSAKVENTLALAYPVGRMEIVFVSDGSTDGTAERISALSGERGGRFRVIALRERRGKMGAVAEAVRRTQGDVVILSDVTAELAPDAVTKLVRVFADPRVGVAGADFVLRGGGVFQRYRGFDNWLRRWESRCHSSIGLSGTCLAFRRQVISDLPGDVILDDIYIPLQAVKAGFRAVVVESVLSLEWTRTGYPEFHRKVRTLAGNYQMMFRFPSLLIPLRSPVAFAWWSHKILRLGTSVFLLAAYGLTMAISGFRGVGFWVQTGFYLGLALAWLLSRWGACPAVVRSVADVSVVLAADLVSPLCYWRGWTGARWRK
ncbi:MAG: glycosyltransferase [Planctomycetota bacterium]